MSMNIENQVCTKEQAERLAALGITQESYFYHYQQILNGVTTFEIYTAGHFDFGLWSVNESVERAISGESKNKIYSAFTVAELGVMLPEFYCSYRYFNNENGPFWKCYNDGNSEYPEDDGVELCPTEAQARAAMLIYLLEYDHITASEVNNRLTTK